MGNANASFVTLLTPLGAAGLAAVRLFGPGVGDLVGRLFVPDRGGDLPTDTARLTLGRVVAPDTGEQIDQAILRLLPGNLGAELTVHGGVRIVQRTLAACDSLGAIRLDLADPAGQEELWRQSLLLAQAGGIPNAALWADVELTLPRTRTRAVADWIIGQWTVGLAAALQSCRPQPFGRDTIALLTCLLADYPARRRAIDGVRVAIVGPTNAGKSTLFNALAGDQAAIVSDQPGTTRDYVSRWASLVGLPAELIDTAGLSPRPTELEAQAATLAEPVVRAADLRLIVLDRTCLPAADSVEASAVERLAAIGPAIWVINKVDVATGFQPVQPITGYKPVPPAARSGPEDGPGQPHLADAVEVSALTGSGLADLVRAIHVRLGIADLSPASPGLFAERQVRLVESALRADAADRAALLGELLQNVA
jgi:tRNA modification GTPase